MFGVRQYLRLQPLPPVRVQEIDIPVFGRLSDQLHVDAVSGEMSQGMRAKRMGQGTGMARFTVADVVEGHCVRRTRVQPVRRLIYAADVPLGWVGVTE